MLDTPRGEMLQVLVFPRGHPFASPGARGAGWSMDRPSGQPPMWGRATRILVCPHRAGGSERFGLTGMTSIVLGSRRCGVDEQICKFPFDRPEGGDQSGQSHNNAGDKL